MPESGNENCTLRESGIATMLDFDVRAELAKSCKASHNRFEATSGLRPISASESGTEMGSIMTSLRQNWLTMAGARSRKAIATRMFNPSDRSAVEIILRRNNVTGRSGRQPMGTFDSMRLPDTVGDAGAPDGAGAGEASAGTGSSCGVVCVGFFPDMSGPIMDPATSMSTKHRPRSTIKLTVNGKSDAQSCDARGGG